MCVGSKKVIPEKEILHFLTITFPLGRDSLKYSTAFEIKPFVGKEGQYELIGKQTFWPNEPVWKYVAKDSVSFHAPYVSGVQRMKNGNTFINEGPKGRFFEVTPEGEIVWEFLNHFRGNIHKPNGDPMPYDGWNYSSFRSNFIPADHPALQR